MTDEDWKRYQLEKHCYYCNQLLGYDKVKDHDHYNGKYRGASHNSCNLNEKKAMFVPVFFHNLSNYDSHLFIKELMTKLPENKNLKLLAKSPEEYISFQFGCFKFLDSYRFLQSSLDNITKSMTDDDFKITRHQFPNTTDFKLLRKKGSVPYSFYTSHESYNVTYLEKSMFFDELKNEMAPDSAYDEAKVIWDHFKIKNHGEFIDLYLKTDVLLLADLFEKFRNVNLNYFQIDPCHCYSAPGLTWQAGLKYTGINLELLTDTDILLTFEKAIRGGISGVMGTRHFKANENHKLLFIDANNLYGWAMMEPQPYGSFEMIEGMETITKEQIMAIPSDSQVGYFFEVDLEYPQSIKFKSKNFPFCPESLFTEDDEVSPYQRELLAMIKDQMQ
uniref:DNA polymerase n=1 Tax=Bartonella sp. CL43QHWL TaxID=3243532 RepID=UPI0035D00644